MKTIPEYLSRQFAEELNCAVAEARGWTHIQKGNALTCNGFSGYFGIGEDLLGFPPGTLDLIWKVPLFSTSLDACRELLADLTEKEGRHLASILMWFADVEMQKEFEIDYFLTMKKPFFIDLYDIWHIVRATARQICVAYLIVKGVLK